MEVGLGRPDSVPPQDDQLGQGEAGELRRLKAHDSIAADLYRLAVAEVVGPPDCNRDRYGHEVVRDRVGDSASELAVDESPCDLGGVVAADRAV